MEGRDFALGFCSATALILILGYFFLPVHSAEMIASPGAEDELLSLIAGAKESICIENYLITSEKVMDALLNASARGVEVRVLLEKRVAGGKNMEAYEMLSAGGVQVRWAPFSFKLLHSKLLIVDGRTALIGSHNLSNSALMENREVSVLVEGPIVAEFLELFERDWNSPGY